MFDSFYIEQDGKTLEVQTKAFDCLLDHYELGEQVAVDRDQAQPILALAENFIVDRIGTDYVWKWAVIIILHDIFADYAVLDSHAEATAAAAYLADAYTDPVRQVVALTRAAEHLTARKRQLEAVADAAHGVLYDYRRHQEREAEGRAPHMLEKFNSWDFRKISLAEALERALNGERPVFTANKDEDTEAGA